MKTGIKHKLALRISLIALLWVEVMTMTFAQDNLAPADMIKKSEAAYAALTSYSDEGKIDSRLNGMNITTTFTIKLGRPNFYCVDWQQTTDSSYSTTITKPHSVWCAGEGDFLDMGQGPQKQASQEMALASATGISGGAACTIPAAFFKLGWGNQLGAMAQGAKQQADDKVGDVDCYVISSELKGRTTTLWIGKQDFLIHQSRTVTSAAAMQSAMDEAAKVMPKTAVPMPKLTPEAVTSTETHTKITVNQNFSAADFDVKK